MGGSRPSRVIKFLNAPECPSRVIKFLYSPDPPPPTVWALDLPTIHPLKVTGGLVCIITIYAPMIYTAKCFGCVHIH